MKQRMLALIFTAMFTTSSVSLCATDEVTVEGTQQAAEGTQQIATKKEPPTFAEFIQQHHVKIECVSFTLLLNFAIFTLVSRWIKRKSNQLKKEKEQRERYEELEQLCYPFSDRNLSLKYSKRIFFFNPYDPEYKENQGHPYYKRFATISNALEADFLEQLERCENDTDQDTKAFLKKKLADLAELHKTHYHILQCELNAQHEGHLLQVREDELQRRQANLEVAQ